MFLLIVRVPIAVSLCVVSIAGLWAIRGERAALGALGQVPYDFSASWTLSAVPMFLLMGTFAQKAGIAASVFRAARVLIGFIPGGLAIATNFAAAGFAAVSGSSLATTAAMGRLAIPEMLEHKYDKALATSVVAAAGHARCSHSAQRRLRALRMVCRAIRVQTADGGYRSGHSHSPGLLPDDLWQGAGQSRSCACPGRTLLG